MDQVEHIAVRPSWDCGACGRPWPCDPARERLRATHGPTPLRILMWGYLEDAAPQLRDAPAGEVFDRFLAWTA